MGTYNLNEEEIYDALEEALDELEGDFSKDTLMRALRKLGRKYKFVV